MTLTETNETVAFAVLAKLDEINALIAKRATDVIGLAVEANSETEAQALSQMGDAIRNARYYLQLFEQRKLEQEQAAAAASAAAKQAAFEAWQASQATTETAE